MSPQVSRCWEGVDPVIGKDSPLNNFMFKLLDSARHLIVDSLTRFTVGFARRSTLPTLLGVTRYRLGGTNGCQWWSSISRRFGGVSSLHVIFLIYFVVLVLTYTPPRLERHWDQPMPGKAPEFRIGAELLFLEWFSFLKRSIAYDWFHKAL